ncbi:ECF transporter S component [Lactobacillus sp. ESL0679]|uniref:ECF transporter S component n=1 Tax=Lactobacillus sp. ESL0679 TaxID=2983209 RepID=UPI0023F7A8BB|nr:ECF transporter S component [Lactobacillus sp. ESL0679]MDF7683271.1 ECF transporter S component [Lactobacillus sp. ESL0679]
MITKYSKWNIKAIILVVLVGIIVGFIYEFGVDNLYNLGKILLLPTGFAPVADALFTGLWLIAAPLAVYFVPLPGAGIIGEFLASVVEMLLGGQWGAMTIFSGLIQGATNEIGFFSKKSRYQRFTWKSVLIGAACAGVSSFIRRYIIYGLGYYQWQLQIMLLIIDILSALLFDGVLVKLITNLFDRALQPRIE